MKLISCNNCGVLLDQDKLKFADDVYSEDGCISDSNARYDQNTKDFGVYVPCPVCKADVFKE